MSFLRIDNLHISLGDFYLKDVSFTLEKRDYLIIIGPTGAGKTILLESIVGFWKPQKGSIYLEKVDITNELPEKRNIGIVYQDYVLLPHFTVFDNIAYGLKKKKCCQKESKIREMACMLNIDHLLHRRPDTLSGGEQQRVALARALVVDPKLLLMDEPFSALDPQTGRETRQLLKRVISKSDITVIHISHDLNDAWALANKTAVLREGALLQFGKVDEIFNRPRSAFIANFVGATILHGTAEKNGNGLTSVNIDGVKLASIDSAINGSDVTVAIRPENIIVLKK
ncbi:MAG: ATP-binding cassette domain-containing protein [Syntrophales bacterium]|jgi:molybdate transport system ATP-binding protein|nr:ATP-binding cassette domain-containing protein [Syntrophales bacterium]MDY0043302.1 ATP-binding cassette domain-containing protein [Syntrophales bacterium]